jgi:hypothetical protein
MVTYDNDDLIYARFLMIGSALDGDGCKEGKLLKERKHGKRSIALGKLRNDVEINHLV